jgi:predicted dienelactone hydrolase
MMKSTTTVQAVVFLPLRCAAVLVVLALVACSSNIAISPQATKTFAQVAVTKSQSTATLAQVTTTRSQTTVTVSPATAMVERVSPEPSSFPLAEPGPYIPGKRIYKLLDASRADRPVSITIWYPALGSPASSGRFAKLGADPNLSGAPYPLILSSTKMATQLAPYLVSHGFTWASVDRIDTYYRMDKQMYQQPLDILFTLQEVASHPPEGLEGMIDAEHAGAIGYSFDGYNTLAMSGARIDPEYYLAQCETTPDATTAAILSEFSSFNCGPAKEWDEFTTLAGESITTSDDGLWQPMTDARIRAVMPLAGEGWWLFGERGLASVDRPALIIVATEDKLYPENVLIFEHLGTADKALISFVGKEHMMIYEQDMVARMTHFAVAFFGYHLQGRQDYAEYFSEDFVTQHDDLAWGVYQGE